MIYEKQDKNRGPRPRGLGKRLDSLPIIEAAETFEKSGALEDGLFDLKGSLNQMESSRNNYNYRTPQKLPKISSN